MFLNITNSILSKGIETDEDKKSDADKKERRGRKAGVHEENRKTASRNVKKSWSKEERENMKERRNKRKTRWKRRESDLAVRAEDK